MATRLGMIAALLFGSGLSALVYQTVWQKLFLFVFGATSDASAAVLGIFLGGLGLGGIVLGKRAETSEQPLYFYGVLELGIGAWAALSPFVIDLTTTLYAMTGGSVSLGRPLAIVVRLVLATLAIGPAAFLMGGTLPAAARAAVANDDTARRGLARIYALNTLGAVFGALVGPLIFFGTLGIQATLYSAVALNLAVGFTAWELGRPKKNQRSERTTHVADKSPSDMVTTGRPLEKKLAFTLAGVVGFAFLFMELVWFRMLAPILGGSSITFGLILATALLGIGIGGFAYSKSADPSQPAQIQTLIFTLCLEALFLITPFAWGEDLALITAHLRAMSNLGYPALVGGWLAVASLIVLPTAVVSGYQFPLLFALVGRGRRGVAREVGATYAFNTIGTICGSLLGGFLLLPAWGATLSWRIVALLLLGAAAVVATVHFRQLRQRGGTKSRAFLIALISCLTLVLCLADGPGRIWRHTPIGAGRVNIGSYSANELVNWRHLKAGSIQWESDGREASVAVQNTDGISFLVNGKGDGAIVGDRGTQIMLGLIPAALHRNPKRSFVVGLGTGTTAGMLGLLPEATRVDVAELEPAIRHVAEMSRLANGNVMANKKVHLLEGDARELLLRKNQKYDLIVSEPSNPYRIGVANLFTREFYQLAKARLDEEGIFTQWIQGYEIDPYTLSTAARTLGDVFTHVSLWNTQGSDFLLIASQTKHSMDVTKLKHRLTKEPFRSWFPRSRFVEGPIAFAAQQLLPARAIHLLNDTVPGSVNTDNLNVMEHRFATNVGGGAELKNQLRALVLQHRVRPDLNGKVQWKEVDAARARLNPTVRWPVQERALSIALGCGGRHQEGAKHWPQDASPVDVIENWVVGYSLAARGDEQAREQASQLARRNFHSEAALIRARLLLQQRDEEASLAELLVALRQLREEALPLCDAIDRALSLSLGVAKARPKHAQKLFDTLVKAPFAIYASDGKRKEKLIEIARHASDDGKLDHKRCTQAYQALEPYPLWTATTLDERARCYVATQAPLSKRAKADLAAFRQLSAEAYVDAVVNQSPVEN